jgi:hypothetical protein
MALVRYSVLYNGPYAVYPSRTGLVDLRTNLAELGGGFNVGDFMDLTEAEAQSWSQQYAAQGAALHEGRYRIVQLCAQATAANIFQGSVVGIAPGRTVQAATILTAGSGQTAGTYTVQGSGGTATTQATLQYVIGSAGTVISATIMNGGNYTTPTIPTFTLAAGGTPGTVQAQFVASSNFVTSFDATAINVSVARGTFLAPVTAAQITAGAFVLIQEEGIGQVWITTATSAASGATVWAQSASGTTTVATSAVPTAAYAGTLGSAMDLPVVQSLCRVQLLLPIRQG